MLTYHGSVAPNLDTNQNLLSDVEDAVSRVLLNLQNLSCLRLLLEAGNVRSEGQSPAWPSNHLNIMFLGPNKNQAGQEVKLCLCLISLQVFLIIKSGSTHLDQESYDL